jgi:hypothetical protein
MKLNVNKRSLNGRFITNNLARLLFVLIVTLHNSHSFVIVVAARAGGIGLLNAGLFLLMSESKGIN